MSETIHTAEYVKSAPTLREAPSFNGKPEIVFVGRSNVGKSSCINMLTNRKNLAKTSNTPGKTRLMNFYLINDTWVLVDLPGYGYAKVSKQDQAHWQEHLQRYLKQRETIQLIILLIDGRHGAQPNDLQMWEWLNRYPRPMLVLLTKCDKLGKQALQKQQDLVSEQLQLDSSLIIPISVESQLGKDHLWRQIKEIIN